MEACDEDGVDSMIYVSREENPIIHPSSLTNAIEVFRVELEAVSGPRGRQMMDSLTGSCADVNKLPPPTVHSEVNLSSHVKWDHNQLRPGHADDREKAHSI